jgi:transcriptional regulator with XRE-family HTH domain
MPLRYLAESGIRHPTRACDHSPVALSGLKHRKDKLVHGLVHAADYPHTDDLVNPHMDSILRQSKYMAKAREILSRNLLYRMEMNSLKTQKELADKAKIGQSHVSRIINGECSATVDRLESMAGALKCEAYELLLDDDEARRALIERLMKGPAVSTERVEEAGFVSMPSSEKRKRKGKNRGGLKEHE